MENEMKTVNLLWTGGWDSTFRMLTLAANNKVRVQPYYIASAERKSSGIERETMQNILKDIYARFPGSEERISPVSLIPRESITGNDKLRYKYDTLNALSPFGTQYTFLAEWSLMSGIDNLEMSIAFKDGRVYAHLDGRCERLEDPVTGEYYRIYPEYTEDSSPYSLFKCFLFPVLGISKIDMMRKAKQAGVFDILNKSWFCHNPHNNRPCGTCNPCKCAMTEGMAFRLPFGAKARYYLNPVKRAVNVLKSGGVKSFAKAVAKKMSR